MYVEGIEPTEEQYKQAAAEAEAEAARAADSLALARAEEAMKEKQAKNAALLQRMRMKTPQQGK
eukprot:5479233-Prymnesium_polylepis.1